MALQKTLPPTLLKWQRILLLKNVEKRSDYEYIKKRVDYYCRLSETHAGVDKEKWEQKSVEVRNQPMTGQKVYYLDSMEYARAFSPSNRWHLLSGDITYVDDVPSIVKSRPVDGNNANSVIMKLDKVRHFIFRKDTIPFREKIDKAIFRGKVDGKPGRLSFVKKFLGNPRFDVGVIDNAPPQCKCEKMSIYDHFKYKYIMTLEGNDVASNLKWVMASNSIAVMPRPKYETWFMEGTLVPNYHYIEVKPDFSDLEEKMDYYTSHPEKAEKIISHAHEFTRQFQNKTREKIISLLVLEKYFKSVANI